MLLTAELFAATDGGIASALGVAQTVLAYVGTVAFAISGAVAAGRKNMDLLGVVVLASIVSVGGGTMRDLLLGDFPVFWVTNPTYLLVGAATAVVVALLTRTRTIDRLHRYQVVQVFDAAGMALFVVVGTNIALLAGAGTVAASVVGVIAGVGGGILRDVLANEIPDVLRSGQFYASAAFVGAVLYVGLTAADVNTLIAFWVPVIVILAIRLVSLRLGWGVPTFVYAGSDGSRPDADAK